MQSVEQQAYINRIYPSGGYLSSHFTVKQPCEVESIWGYSILPLLLPFGSPKG